MRAVAAVVVGPLGAVVAGAVPAAETAAGVTSRVALAGAEGAAAPVVGAVSVAGLAGAASAVRAEGPVAAGPRGVIAPLSMAATGPVAVLFATARAVTPVFSVHFCPLSLAHRVRLGVPFRRRLRGSGISRLASLLRRDEGHPAWWGGPARPA
ncbi:hypothetical protein Aple_101460 [Acrocarpospora pleiomorpha]|uniref:Uncharacterized protein n=1 Tax=Acrocarpospora pleiomorpha TaxID=90975 RepID=A0A5M3Y1Z6_9ACTN|nr:hypothetical protein [Acrocarpospora pleiomorpha]GES27246.1 hypothetical protein Aple_101460 [Acrocarpospora pleiomorpha]